MYLAAMLQEIPEMDNTGIEIKYRFDGGLFNLFRLRSQKLNKATRITELQYADDNALPAHTTEEMQRSVNYFKNAYDRFGLTINIQKTKVLAQPAPATNLAEFNITISDTPLDNATVKKKWKTGIGLLIWLLESYHVASSETKT